MLMMSSLDVYICVWGLIDFNPTRPPCVTKPNKQVAGSFVGALADNYGRKKMCIMYAVFYAISCLVKLVNNYYVLMVRALFLSFLSVLSLFWKIHIHTYTPLSLSPHQTNKTNKPTNQPVRAVLRRHRDLPPLLLLRGLDGLRAQQAWLRGRLALGDVWLPDAGERLRGGCVRLWVWVRMGGWVD
jgi:hypothetical protein